MRTMAYVGSLILLVALWGLWRRKRLATSRWFLRAAIWSLPLPFLANTAGWVLTENGRQPWIVQGLMQTKDAASPSVGAATIMASLVIFALLYAVLAAVDWWLMARYARKELAPEPSRDGGERAAPEMQPTY
jgi:cytochrome bd-type quinol oxidase subunit 1